MGNGPQNIKAAKGGNRGHPNARGARASFFSCLLLRTLPGTPLLLPLSLRAQETSGFTLLNSGLPSVLNTASLPEFLRGLFQVSIAAAGVLAVIMIAIAGIQYMGTDAYSSKEQAKERIRGAVLGLLIIFGSFVFLRTINPDIVSLRFVLERITYRDDSAFWEGLNRDVDQDIINPIIQERETLEGIPINRANEARRIRDECYNEEGVEICTTFYKTSWNVPCENTCPKETQKIVKETPSFCLCRVQ